MSIYRLSANCAVSGQIEAADIPTLAVDGFVTVICNRPDGEDFGQPRAADIEAACNQQGIEFHFIPISRSGLNSQMIEDFRNAVANSEGMVLAYCRSGQRSSVIWQASGSP
ncbi:MAG: TIGR01244 family sulfur transferase [Woeseiaceae bacterium]|nr:TIGR01244 family sulfur transferase [Woeseiaceae bacterium]